MSEESEERSVLLAAGADPWARPLVDFCLPALFLGGLTLIFYFLPIDLQVEDWFYSAEQGGWFLKDAEPLQQIYKKGLIPALCVTVAAIALLIAGFASAALRRYRKVAIYLLLVMLIAPGLLVNALMKEGWGRPRPRQVEQFGGQEAYERVWEYDSSSYGKSFPSGHAAMGFYFFGLYFLMRREGRAAILLWLAVALGLGGLLGVTRMVQGGHFPSDVLWSGGVCYFVAAGAYYAMGLHRDLWFRGGGLSRSAWLGCVVALLGIGLLAVGTPYHEEKSFAVSPAELDGATGLEAKLELPRANLRLSAGSQFSFSAEAEGFGSPGSRLEDRFEIARVGERCELWLRQEKSGLFATVEQAMSLVVPEGLAFDGELIVSSGVVTLDLADFGMGKGVTWDLDLELGEADLLILVPDGLGLKVELGDGVAAGGAPELDGLDWDEVKRRFKRGDQPSVKLRVKAQGDGKISFHRAGH